MFRQLRQPESPAGVALTLSSYTPTLKLISSREGPSYPDLCSYGNSTFSNNQITRIGELHVANQSGVKGTYSYNTTADSSMTIGGESGGSQWSADGSVSVNNSIGGGGSVPHTGGWVKYVDDHMNYEHQFWSCEQLILPDSSNGDVFDGVNAPGGNPWGNCANAPLRGEVPTNGGTWHGLTDSAINLSWAFTAFGLFDGNGSTGYETNNQISYVNNSGSASWVCGAGGHGDGLAGSPVIYNNPS